MENKYEKALELARTIKAGGLPIDWNEEKFMLILDGILSLHAELEAAKARLEKAEAELKYISEHPKNGNKLADFFIEHCANFLAERDAGKGEK